MQLLHRALFDCIHVPWIDGWNYKMDAHKYISFFICFIQFCQFISCCGIDCNRVNCTRDFEHEITTWAPDRYCSFKTKTDTDRKQGLWVQDFADKSWPGECNSVLLSRTPTNADHINADVVYKECCAGAVISECFYKVRATSKCGDDDVTNDEMKQVEVVFRNADKERVKVNFYPDKYNVQCIHTNKQGEQLSKEEMDGTPLVGQLATVNCGMGVRLEKRHKIFNNKYRTVEIKAKRYACNSQNVAMFRERSTEQLQEATYNQKYRENSSDKNRAKTSKTDYTSTLGDVKFSLYTVVAKTANSDRQLKGVHISPVLGETKDGLCGERVRSVVVTRKRKL